MPFWCQDSATRSICGIGEYSVGARSSKGTGTELCYGHHAQYTVTLYNILPLGTEMASAIHGQEPVTTQRFQCRILPTCA